MTDAIALPGLHVRRDKNLVAAYAPWLDGVSSFGVNGPGGKATCSSASRS